MTGGRRFYVYRLCDDIGVIYVGYTENPARRMQEHRRSKAWFRNVLSIEVSEYASKTEALREEAMSILFGERLHNKQLHPRLAREAFEDASAGIHYPIIERYNKSPGRRRR